MFSIKKSIQSLSRTFLSVLLFICLAYQPLFSQVINFSIHVASSLDATKDADMAFPQVSAGDGLTAINLGDGGMGVFAISGNEELDIEVILTAPAELVHTTKPSNTMGLDLKFAYANTGVNDINVAKTVNGNSARFQLRERTSGPAGAPPTPPNSSHVPNITTAYIYLYGSINVGNISSGNYSGTVDLSVQYY